MKGEKIYKKALALAYKSPEELKSTYDLLEKAMKLGNADAIVAISSWYWFGKYLKMNRRKAVKLLRIAAKENHREACYRLATCYEDGEVIKKNEAKAFKWYLRGALAGDKSSIQEIGRFYWHGLGGVKSNKSVARIWFDFGGEYQDDYISDTN